MASFSNRRPALPAASCPTAARASCAYADAAGRAVPALPIVGMLRIGMTAEAVRRLQGAPNLATNRAAILVDGAFGRATEIAVQQFQAARGLQADGVVGPVTAGALGV